MLWRVINYLRCVVEFVACLTVSTLLVRVGAEIIAAGEIALTAQTWVIAYDVYLTLNLFGALSMFIYLVNNIPRFGRWVGRTLVGAGVCVVARVSRMVPHERDE